LENNNKIIAIGTSILIVLLVVGAGLFAINQYLDYRYKSVFLSSPCVLCQKVNPELDNCFKIKKEIVYPIIDNTTFQFPNLQNLS
jgi:hypothetical protein